MIKFKDLGFKVNQVWLSSDFYAFHRNLCKGTSTWSDTSQCRDFKDEIEMTEYLAYQINKYVYPDHLLIHCGDWSFGGKENVLRFRHKLSCQNIINIEGNHDHHRKEFGMAVLYNHFLEYKQIGYYQFQGEKIVCTHYPNLIWHQSHRGSRNMFGHVHGSNKGVGRSLDVGIDNAFKLFGEYRPFSLREALDICDKREVYLESHHTPKTN